MKSMSNSDQKKVNSIFQIRFEANMHKIVSPKKHLGQHFLKDEKIAQKVALLFGEDRQELTAVEIGPGMGVLTQYLLQYYKEVYAVEIDKESVEYLKAEFTQKKLKVLDADFKSEAKRS